MGKSQKINVTLPGYLISKIDSMVEKGTEIRDRSKFLQVAALEKIARAEQGQGKAAS